MAKKNKKKLEIESPGMDDIRETLNRLGKAGLLSQSQQSRLNSAVSNAVRAIAKQQEQRRPLNFLDRIPVIDASDIAAAMRKRLILDKDGKPVMLSPAELEKLRAENLKLETETYRDKKLKGDKENAETKPKFNFAEWLED